MEIKTLYFKDISQTEAKLEVIEWGEEYSPCTGTVLYREIKTIFFLTTEEEISAAREVADVTYFCHLPNNAVNVQKWEDIRA